MEDYENIKKMNIYLVTLVRYKVTKMVYNKDAISLAAKSLHNFS